MTGDENKCFIIRRGPNDVPEFLSVRFQDLMWGKDATADVRLAPYDVVYVPRSGIAEVYRFMDQYLLQFVPVSWGFSYVVGGATGGTGSDCSHDHQVRQVHAEAWRGLPGPPAWRS